MTIDSALRSYLERPDTQHAVMINGEWGVGKTHYVVRELMPSLPDMRFCYISAYGMQSVDELKKALHDCLVKLNSREAESQIVVCVDDLERWHGNLELCLSYINLLAEHEGKKCLLIGNIQEFSKRNAAVFVKAQEKTIRQVFQFHRPLSSVVKIALTQVNYPSKSCRQFVRGLIMRNEHRLVMLMRSIGLYNIRLVSESFQLFTHAYRRHAGIFKGSRQLTFTWYLALLSVLVLVKRSLISEDQKTQLFRDDHSRFHGYQFLSNIGYFDKSDTHRLGNSTRILLDTIFYRLDKIRLSGILSLVRHGYYVADDFQQNFSNWDENDYIQIYLDREEYYGLDNQKAQAIFELVYRDLMIANDVRNPLTILFLSERIIEDIANAVIDINPVDFRRNILEILDRLYQHNKMESVSINILDITGNRFVNCKTIHHYMMEKNQRYLDRKRRNVLAHFWQDLKSSDGHFSEFLDRHNPLCVLSETPSASTMIDALERLDNHRLKEVAHWLSRDSEIDPNALDLAQPVIHEALSELKERYTNSLGVRANHFRSITRALSHLDETTDDTVPLDNVKFLGEPS